MHTALLLLLLLAVAAVPGSLVPQRSSDPNGVTVWRDSNPGLTGLADVLQLHDVYGSIWFSAIYILLFVSLIGCILPRTKHHLKAMRSVPPRTPSRLGRLPASAERRAGGEIEAALEHGRTLLRKRGYRVARYGDSLSAERGYLRETGNLVFHMALVGVLATLAIGGGFVYTGQKILVQGQTFVNYVGGFDSWNPGRFFADERLEPYTLTLDRLAASYQSNPLLPAYGQPVDFDASVTTTLAGGESEAQSIRVNEPLEIGGTDVFLLGNGYAPHITVRDANGDIAFADVVPFLPQDQNLTSVGVVKVPDAATQLGLQGFFYPTYTERADGSFTSFYPGLGDPLLSLRVFSGDLGLDAGIPESVFVLDTDDLEPVAGGDADVPALQLVPGETVDIPGGLGTVTFDDMSSSTGGESVPRFASLDIHHDPTQVPMLVFALLVLAGLLTGLFVPRRRLWIAVEEDGTGLRIRYAGLARGDDPVLERAVEEVAEQHSAMLPAAPVTAPVAR